MAKKVWDPRLSIRLTEDQFTELQNELPWGTKNAIFSALVDWMLETIKDKGIGVLLRFAQGKATLCIEDKKKES